MIILYSILALVLVLIIIVRIMLVRRGGHSFPWLQFYIRGKEAGFRMAEIGNLQRLVMSNKLRDPLSVYWSRQASLSCVKYMDGQYRQEDTLENSSEARFMRKLYDLLNRVTLNSQEKKRGIQHTRELDPSMPLDVFYKNTEYKSRVIEVRPRYVAIAYPRVSPTAEKTKFSSGDQIVVKFWRKGDSGYHFSTRVAGSHDDSIDIIHIQHARKISRAQTRSLMRKDVNKSGSLFLIADLKDVRDDDQGDERGLRCQVLDISEGGMSLLIGGKISDQFGFKVQARIAGISIVMVARLVHSDYNRGKDVSLLRLKSISRNIVMRNRISAVVYAVYSEPETEQEDAEML